MPLDNGGLSLKRTEKFNSNIPPKSLEQRVEELEKRVENLENPKNIDPKKA